MLTWIRQKLDKTSFITLLVPIVLCLCLALSPLFLRTTPAPTGPFTRPGTNVALATPAPWEDTGCDNDTVPDAQPSPTMLANLPTPAPNTTATRTPQATQRVLTVSTTLSNTTIALFELPFPYDGENVNFGGTDEQFLSAVRPSVLSGRVNSYFDHAYPLYRGEPTDVRDGILAYFGEYSTVGYSGHPAYDFRTFEWHKATTPVFAPADSYLVDVGIEYDALVVKLRHDVPGIGSFQTMYMHLDPDAYYDAIQTLFTSAPGVFIPAGTRIGTMGNTGRYTTGHHLHFETWFDQNHDSEFSSYERIDPFGFIPSTDFPADPWELQQLNAFDLPATALYAHSFYLWRHPLTTSAVIPTEGARLDHAEGQGGGEDEPAASGPCVPPGAVPAGSVINVSFVPLPNDPGLPGAPVGMGCRIDAHSPDGQPLARFDPPMQIALPYTDEDVASIDETTLTVYLENVNGAWEELVTRLDPAANLALAQAPHPGDCVLRGTPLRDTYPPQTTISVFGPRAEGREMVFTGGVVVTLSATDPFSGTIGASGVQTVTYSIDGGQTWLTYLGPFGLVPNGVPPITGNDDNVGDTFGKNPGEFVVLAVTHDQAGNREDPPSTIHFLIDITRPVARASAPEQAPGQATPTAGPIPTLPPASFGITETPDPKETSAAAPNTDTETPEFGADTETPDPFLDTETPDPFLDTETPDPFFDTETPDPFLDTETPDPFFDTETPDPFLDTETPDPFLDTETPDPFLDTETPDPFLDTETPDPFLDTETPDPFFDTETPDPFFDTETPTPEFDTDTPEPDTDTPVPPDTDTPEPDTDTPVPPDTDTPEPDTDTPVPPDTDTPEPDTDTPFARMPTQHYFAYLPYVVFRQH